MIKLLMLDVFAADCDYSDMFDLNEWCAISCDFRPSFYG